MTINHAMARNAASPHTIWRAAVWIAALGLFAAGCASNSGPDALSQEKRGEHQRRASMHYDLGVQKLKEGNAPLAIRELLAATKYNADDAAILQLFLR